MKLATDIIVLFLLVLITWWVTRIGSKERPCRKIKKMVKKHSIQDLKRIREAKRHGKS